MDQSVIETLKRRYRKQFLRELTSEDNVSMQDFWKRYNLKNAIDNASDAWRDIPNETLEKSWKKLWPGENDPTASIDCVDSTSQINSEAASIFGLEMIEANEWLHCDADDVGYQLLTDDEIIQEISNETDTSEINEDGEDGGEADEGDLAPVDSCQEAKEAGLHLQKFIDWYGKQEEADITHTMLLRRFRNFASKKAEKKYKQAHMTDFFHN